MSCRRNQASPWAPRPRTGEVREHRERKPEKPSLSVGSTTPGAVGPRAPARSRRNQAPPWALRPPGRRGETRQARRNQASPWLHNWSAVVRVAREYARAGETKPLRGLHDDPVDALHDRLHLARETKPLRGLHNFMNDKKIVILNLAGETKPLRGLYDEMLLLAAVGETKPLRGLHDVRMATQDQSTKNNQPEKPSLSVGFTTAASWTSSSSIARGRRNQASPWAPQLGNRFLWALVHRRPEKPSLSVGSTTFADALDATLAIEAGETKPLRGLHDLAIA